MGVAEIEKPTTEEVGREFLADAEEGPEALDEGCRRDAHDFFNGGTEAGARGAGAGAGVPGFCASDSAEIGSAEAGAGDDACDPERGPASNPETDALCTSSPPFSSMDATEVFEVTGEPGRVGVSLSVTADEGTADVTVDVDWGGVCDCMRGGV